MRLVLLLVIAGVSAAAEDTSWNSQLQVARQLKQQGHFQEAGKVLTELLSKTEQDGPDTLEVALTLVNLADVDAALGREWEAAGEYERCLSLLEKKNGTEDELTLLVVHRLGRLNVQMARFPRAEALLKRVIASRRRAAVANPRQVAAALRDLAMVYILEKDPERGEPVVREALETLDKDTNRHDVQRAGTLNVLAWVMLGTRRFEEGIGYAELSLRLLKGANASASSVIDSSITLGLLYLCVDRLDEASHILKPAVDRTEVKQWDDQYRLQTALRAYAAVLRRQNRKAEAKSAEKRAGAIQAETGRAQPTVDINTFLPRRGR